MSLSYDDVKRRLQDLIGTKIMVSVRARGKPPPDVLVMGGPLRSVEAIPEPLRSQFGEGQEGMSFIVGSGGPGERQALQLYRALYEGGEEESVAAFEKPVLKLRSAGLDIEVVAFTEAEDAFLRGGSMG